MARRSARLQKAGRRSETASPAQSEFHTPEERKDVLPTVTEMEAETPKSSLPVKKVPKSTRKSRKSKRVSEEEKVEAPEMENDQVDGAAEVVEAAEATETATVVEVVEPTEPTEPAEPEKPAENVATPSTGRKFMSFLTQRTPRNKTEVSCDELHPHHHHQTTAKPLEEARWLGFLSKGAYTAPVRSDNKLAVAQGTPTKAVEIQDKPNPFSTPEFKFRYKRPSLELSPEAKRMMEQSREEAARIRAQMVAASDEFSPVANKDRKIAQAKGKASRFSDVHMAQFKKMDSIANHPSAFRADPNRMKPGNTALKRTQSKAELDEPELPKGGKRNNSVKLPDSPTKAAAGATVKRLKLKEGDDASSSRPAPSEDSDAERLPPPATAMHHRIRSGIPRANSNLMTPTKASLARSQSVKPPKTISHIPLPKSPSMRKLTTAPTSRTLFGIRTSNHTFRHTVRSILRSPQRLYSADPEKIAAGTHVAASTTPPTAAGPAAHGGLDLNKELPRIPPATAPVQKHKKVNFSASTKEDPLPSPSAGRAVSEVPATVEYPALPGSESSVATTTLASPTRRQTLAELPSGGDFTFRSDRPIKFGPATTGPSTIRRVRPSGELLGSIDEEGFGKKRKAGEGVDEDKENVREETDEGDGERKAKRARPSVAATAPAVKTPVKRSHPMGSRIPATTGRLGSSRAGAGRRAPGGGITPARLALLATPKRRA